MNLATVNSTLLNPRLSLSNIWQSRLLVQDCAAKLEKLGLKGAIQEVSMIKVNQEKSDDTGLYSLSCAVIQRHFRLFFCAASSNTPHPVLGIGV